MKKRIVKEFINSNGDIGASKIPILDPNTTSNSTTDRQVSNIIPPEDGNSVYGLRMYEKDMEYSKEALMYEKTPKKFYEFLKEKKKEHLFGEYFEKKSIKSELYKISKNKVIDMVEDIVKKSKDYVVLSKQKPTIEEIKNKENLLLSKLDRISNSFKSILSEDEKDVLIEYFKNCLKNG